MSNENNKPCCLKVGTAACGAIFALVGAALALMLIFIGFWNTLLVAVFAAAGYFLGATANKPEAFKRLINRWFPPKDQQ